MASWNYGSGPYGSSGYPSYPGAPGASDPNLLPPGMAPPPGMAMPPGVNATPAPMQGGPGGFPATFRMPANININAPVIRLGSTPSTRDVPPRGGNAEPVSNRRGLGAERSDSLRIPPREPTQLFPPTREELARTIFVGNIDNVLGGDAALERVLRCAGSLRRWTRVTDGDNKPCSFGFAEYEDAESLETAAEVFKDIEVPVSKVSGRAAASEAKAESDIKTEEDDTKDKDGAKMVKLLVIVDAESQKYAAEWRERRGDDEATTQFRIDAARDNLASTLASLVNPTHQEPAADTTMTDMDDPTGEIIPLNTGEPEDELSDIPPEMRETVAKEIAKFRDHSFRRDSERVKQEGELGAQFAARQKGGQGASSVAPAVGANGIPLGPRNRGVDGAPSGPRSQMPKDYRDPVRFANGEKHMSIWDYISKKDEDDSDLDDFELEQRRREKKKSALEAVFNDGLRVWTKREHNKVSAVEREAKRDKDESQNFEKRKADMAKKLKGWSDDVASAKNDLFYTDHAAWAAKRSAARRREYRDEENDRRAEEHENQRRREEEERARGQADSFLNKMQVDLAAPTEPARIKLNFSLGTASTSRTPAQMHRKTAFEIEGLLDDEEQEQETEQRKRSLKNLELPALEETARLTAEEREKVLKQIAANIPTDMDALFSHEIAWNFISEEIIEENLQPIVERVLVEMIGVQEQLLVDVVLEHVRKHSTPQVIMEELQGAALELEEATTLVKKLWRMVVFYSERETRGL